MRISEYAFGGPLFPFPHFSPSPTFPLPVFPLRSFGQCTCTCTYTYTYNPHLQSALARFDLHLHLQQKKTGPDLEVRTRPNGGSIVYAVIASNEPWSVIEPSACIVVNCEPTRAASLSPVFIQSAGVGNCLNSLRRVGYRALGSVNNAPRKSVNCESVRDSPLSQRAYRSNVIVN